MSLSAGALRVTYGLGSQRLYAISAVVADVLVRAEEDESSVSLVLREWMRKVFVGTVGYQFWFPGYHSIVFEDKGLHRVSLISCLVVRGYQGETGGAFVSGVTVGELGSLYQ